MTNIVVDAHQDIAWNYFNNGRDFGLSAWEKRRREASRPTLLKHYGYSMCGLPEALLGRVAVIGSTIYAAPAHAAMYSDEIITYDTPQAAYEWGLRQLGYYQQLAETHEHLILVRTQADLDTVLASWGPGCTLADHRVGLIVLMEGADPILEPAQVEEWYERGLRIVGPAWTATRYAGGTGAPGPLTDMGRELLEAMASFGMVLDLSHLTPDGWIEAVDRYEGPVFASHANPLRFRPDAPNRNPSDDMIMRLAERDGVLGIIPFNLFLKSGWRKGDRKNAACMDDVIAAIDHVCQLTGSARHVGIGSDFDGGFGSESAPLEFETTADLLALGPALAGRGYAPEDVAAILSDNFLRVLRAGLPGE